VEILIRKEIQVQLNLNLGLKNEMGKKEIRRWTAQCVSFSKPVGIVRVGFVILSNYKPRHYAQNLAYAL
jgi:hypothetical protein